LTHSPADTIDESLFLLLPFLWPVFAFHLDVKHASFAQDLLGRCVAQDR
jgi:hypothetical protein